MNSPNLKIALQKSGRLSDASTALLKKCGIKFDNGTAGKLKSAARNFPLEIFFLRDDDIPQYIEDGVADIGIVGENVLSETQCEVKIYEKLGFGRCRLALAVPKTFEYGSIKDLSGKRIATSYPKILDEFLEKNNIAAEIHTISGSVEIAPSINLADAVCDLVSSGNTLFTNGLREVETVINSEAVLVCRHNLERELQTILEKLLFRIRAVKAAAQNKYILLNAPNKSLEEIVKLLPGIKSPTIMPLASGDWSSVHSVVGENDFWEIVEQLKDKGAEGILVISIDQMIQ
ncbi:MAG: ATP phosphoribosyltransferase [Pyrinomonadaceae bacterium]